MINLLRTGKHLIPVEHIALIEPYVPDSKFPLNATRDFKSRIVLLNRDSILSEENCASLAEHHGFRAIPSDGVATNPTIRFRVEKFEPAESFRPSKPYQTRLSWTDLDGNTQSKLLLTEPEAVLAIAVRGEPEGLSKASPAPPKRPASRRARGVKRVGTAQSQPQ